VYRLIDKSTGKLKADLIALTDEQYDTDKDLEIFHPVETWKRSLLEGGSYEMREILVPVFKKGQCVYESPKTMDIRSYCQQELSLLWDETRRLVNPQEVYVDLSKPLYDLKMDLLNKRGNRQ
jgi:nicotinate phosphoribosyltransferase